MNYKDPELQSRLASEYVLGILRGRARQRFERLLRTEPELQQAVDWWQNKLADLNQIDRSVTPPDRVWSDIEARLFAESPASPTVSRLWQWLAMGASALSIAMAIYIARPLLQPSPTLQDKFLSIFEDESRQAIWTVQIDESAGALKVNSYSVPIIEDDQDYELWLLLPNEQPPVSLGLLPEGGNSVLPFQDLPYNEAQGIAVSLEPAGGSVTGAPTGPVLYVAGLYGID